MDNIKKILIVQHNFHYSGASSQRLIGYAKTFVKTGHEVVMIVSPQKPFTTNLEGVRFIKIKEERKQIFRCLYKFVKTIKREYTKDSVIFFYEPYFYSVLFRSPKYKVFSEQTEIPHCGYKPTLKQRVLEIINMYAKKHFSGVAVISKGLKEYYIGKGVKNLEVINMFVDASRFDKMGVKPDEKYIAYCGTVSVRKDGVDTLIQAFSIFQKTHPDYKLYLMGQFDVLGSEDILKELISRLNLDKSVIFKGCVSADVLPNILSGARMLALARPNTVQAQYGFPTKLGEYLATGKPVVVTKVGEIPLYLRDGDNAFLAEPGTPESFAKKLLEVEADYVHALKIGEKGRELVYSEFSSVVQSKKLLNFMNDTIEKSNSVIL